MRAPPWRPSRRTRCLVVFPRRRTRLPQLQPSQYYAYPVATPGGSSDGTHGCPLITLFCSGGGPRTTAKCDTAWLLYLLRNEHRRSPLQHVKYCGRTCIARACRARDSSMQPVVATANTLRAPTPMERTMRAPGHFELRVTFDCRERSPLLQRFAAQGRSAGSRASEVAVTERCAA